VSIQDIRPNPQDTSNFYLANIYRTIAEPNGSNISSSLPISPPPFSPPNYAVWVNALWFLSLLISLTCALLATLLQQWARRYLKLTQSRYSLHKRARIRAFYAEGVEKLLLPWTVETLPTLLHTSLFLFFAGLVVFLLNVNITTFKLVLSWAGICMALYGCITMMPIFHHDSPYRTPLSLPAWHIVTGMSFVTFWVLQWVTDFQCFSDSAYVRFWNLKNKYRKFLKQGMQKMAEETALRSPLEIDVRAFMWTFDRLDEDHELERFFAGLPGLRSSRFVNYPLPSLTHEQRWELSQALTGLLDRTFTSDLLPAPVKNRRAIICAKAVDPAYIPHAFTLFDKLLSKCQYGGPLATGIVEIVRGWPISTDECTILYAQAILSMIVARVQPRDGSWFVLASNELGVPETVLRDYAAHGDNLSLAILIHVIHQQLTHYRKWTWPRFEFWKVLEAASKFNGQDTSPTLRHKFCTLWNQIVFEVKNDNDEEKAGFILRLIRHVHIALHQDTDPPPFTDGQDDILEEASLYTVCNAVGHIHDDSTSTTFPRTVLPDSASLASPNAPSSSVTAPLHVVKSLVDVPPLDNFHLARQTAIAYERRDIVNSGIIVPRPILETVTSAPPLSPISPPAAIAAALRHNPDLLMPFNAPTLLSSASSNPVLDNILRTGPLLSSHFPITRPDLSPSCPESHRSIIVTTAPSVSLGPTSTPDLGTAAEELETLFTQRKGRT
jgi:hypothetical protein